MSQSELLDVLDERGVPTGEVKPRFEVHREGIWHGTVHIWLINDRGELLLQHRGLEQESNPGLWDVSSAGHCVSGDSVLEAAVREVEEELGWSVEEEDLIPLGRLKSQWRGNGWVDREFCQIYGVEVSQPYPEFQLQASELQGVEWIDWKVLEQRVKVKDAALVEHDEEYALLFQWLKERDRVA